ncbi:hypothetical protein HRG_013600 [Hirsutella rhossiliensis]
MAPAETKTSAAANFFAPRTRHDDMPDADTPEPPLNSSHMTLAEKAGLIKKWADNKQKHVRKKRDKNSHVYWYMQRKL